MKRRCESSARDAKRIRVASFLMEALPTKDLCDIILEYSVEFEGRRLREIKLQWECNALAELHDGKIALGCSDMKVRVLDPVGGDCLQTLAGHTGTVHVLAVLPDGKLVSGSSDNTVRVWDKDQCLLILAGHTDWVHALAVFPDGKLASGSWDHTVRVWEDGACLYTLEGHTGNVRALAMLPDGKLATGSGDKTVRVWDVASGACACSRLQATHTQFMLWLRCLTASWRPVIERRCGCGTL